MDTKRYVIRVNDKEEIDRLKKEQKDKEKYLKTLAVEYVMMGKECEKDHFIDAAIRNYNKALTLCPDIPEAKRRLKKLSKISKND